MRSRALMTVTSRRNSVSRSRLSRTFMQEFRDDAGLATEIQCIMTGLSLDPRLHSMTPCAPALFCRSCTAGVNAELIKPQSFVQDAAGDQQLTVCQLRDKGSDRLGLQSTGRIREACSESSLKQCDTCDVARTQKLQLCSFQRQCDCIITPTPLLSPTN